MSAPTDKQRLKSATLLRICIGGIFVVMLFSGIARYGFGVDVLQGLPERSICPIRFVTRHDCPGCGMTRAMLSIGQGRLVSAVNFNPIAPVLFGFMVFFLIRGRSPRVPHRDRYAIAGLVVVMMLWVLRF